MRRLPATLLALSLCLVAPAPARGDRPLGPPERRTIRSPDGSHEAVTDPRTFTTTIAAVGEDGERTARWAMYGWFRVAHLADDGEHLVVGYPGSNLLPLDYEPDEIVLRFVRRGEQIAVVTLEEMLPDLSVLERTVSHWAWRHGQGFDEEGRFYVDTVDGRRHLFDVAGGRRLEPER